MVVCFAIAALTSFHDDFEKGDEVILTKGNHSENFYIGETTIEDVLKRFGKAKVETEIVLFPGSTQKKLYSKRQSVKYSSTGLEFIFEYNVLKSKRETIKDTCLLDEVIIGPNSEYCVNNICIGSTQTEVIQKLGPANYPIKNMATDSLSLSYPAYGLLLKFKKSNQIIKLDEINRSETESYFEYTRAKAYQKASIPLDSIK